MAMVLGTKTSCFRKQGITKIPRDERCKCKTCGAQCEDCFEQQEFVSCRVQLQRKQTV